MTTIACDRCNRIVSRTGERSEAYTRLASWPTEYILWDRHRWEVLCSGCAGGLMNAIEDYLKRKS